MKNINNESIGDGLLDAIGDIGDDIVAEAASFKVKTPMLYRKLWITAAVLICTLALFGGAFYLGGRNSTEPPEVPSITESETSETAENTENITEAPAVTESGIIPTVTKPQVPQAPTVTPTETTAEVTEPEPTTAAATEPEKTTAAVTETHAPQAPTIVPPETTEAVTEAPVTDAPAVKPPETTVVPTEPIDPPEVRPEDYKTVKGPEGGIGISGVSVVGNPSASSSVMGAPPMAGFEVNGYTFAVKASVIKNLPDVYYVYNEYSYAPAKYRVILMKTEDVLYGKNVPEYFYYAIESGLYADMSVYDFLFISMRQLGTDGFVMTNSSDMMTESFPLPVFNSYLPQFGRVIPFTNGIFDESLWQTPSWIFGYQFIETDLNDQTYHDVKRGCTAEYTLERIKPDNRTNEPTVVALGNLKSIDADSVSYVTDFANGTFMQYYNVYNKTVTFQRFIYGCETDEVLKFDTNKKTCSWSETRYSVNELSGLPNITKHIEELETEYSISKPNPPHVSPGDVPLRGLTFFGYYIKHEGKLYGVVKTSWVYIDWNYETDLETSYTDQAFVLFENGIPRDISREELLTFKPFFPIYMGDYSAQVNHIVHG